MTNRIAGALVALALALPLPALAQGGDPNLRAEIEKMGRAWEKAFNAGDAAALAALYANDAKVMPPGSEVVSGTSAIRKLFEPDVSQGVKFTLKMDDVVGFGEHAVETGTFVVNSAEGKHLDHGSFTTVYKKVNGGWKIHRDIWNSSMPRK
jgi:uncharacterized protein (TIGR02246 family)